VARFRADLADRGRVVDEPGDLFTDPEWSRALTSAYLLAV
jgi:hypothetical protein